MSNTALFEHFDRHAGGVDLKGGSTHYCPGCGHGLAHKFIGEAIVDLGIEDRTVMVSPVGCAVFLFYYFDTANTQAAHGRAPAVALGHKLAHPESIVISYQGDGDLASIGLAEIIHAAQLGMPISVIFINNTIYGMTGGQMAPTTLMGQPSTTAPQGRTAMQGQPMKVAEMIAGLEGVVYVERTALFDQRNRKKTQKAIKKAIRLQMEGRGFSMVEIISECPVHWKMTPEESEEHVKNVVVEAFPLGVVKDEEREPWIAPRVPKFDADSMVSALGATEEKPPRFCSEFPSHLDPVDIAIKFAGAGGDGAQTAAILLTQAAINEGFDSTDIPSYGPESRGGTSYADVHVAKDEVLSPAAPTPHVLLAFNAPSLEKFASSVAENGIVIYDTSVISVPPDFPVGVKAYGVPCGDVAVKLGNKVVKNIVALGALQEATQLLTDESILTVLRSVLRRKPNLIEINEKAYAEGVRHVRESKPSIV
ncbi:MAG: 2-oxoacid:acceptor oxidoreductase family protein [Planctomycetota bacterium]|jgi:2-oxoisovalerate ferredoxin oxidoreductase beta subunit|nr:2-oxoacid:acceptor oxidoreductase family protein [Planctomycetota bacterium]MDP6739982.1 2-oxoacid:acceptor oxidoreductase family protein [Planctomycetota bacterium]MDP6940223.1 2-oxoacid:acceptor oxidoreductase family protein [Planctomycetota bacterium]